jgi:hypothetical protein
MLRPGSAGSNTAADHLRLPGEAIAALPPRHRRKLMITCDGAGASHDLVRELYRLAARPGLRCDIPLGDRRARGRPHAGGGPAFLRPAVSELRRHALPAA